MILNYFLISKVQHIKYLIKVNDELLELMFEFITSASNIILIITNKKTQINLKR